MGEDYKAVILMVKSYDFERNEFRAVIASSGEEVVFDPFVGGEVMQCAEEYEDRTLAHSMVGHLFVVAERCRASDGSYCPGSPWPMYSETWKRPVETAESAQ